jgi:hypothetical protein
MSTVFLIPESPRWLCRKGRGEQARVNLAKFRGLPQDDPVVQTEIGGIELALEETGHTATSMKDIFTMGKDKLFYRFSLCILLQLLQQMCGRYVIRTSSLNSSNPKLTRETATSSASTPPSCSKTVWA